jgi:uncharacterized membrane protein YhaH (DUF805 family)
VEEEDIMSPVSALFLGLGVMLVVSGVVLMWIRPAMHRLLVELCGEEHRARFWGQLYAASVILTVALAVVFFPPDPSRWSPGGALFDLLPMFRAALVGLLVCLGVLSLTMVRFIAEHDRRHGPTDL